MKKVLFLALSGGSADHLNNQKAQEQTWADNRNPSAMTIWMHGKSDIQTPYMEGYNLVLPVAETYENLLHKTILGLKWVLNNIEFEYLVRTNTSNYFSTHLLSNFIDGLNHHREFLCGAMGEWRGNDDQTKINFVSGAGIIMPKRTAEKLASLNFNDYLDIPDDVAISMFLNQIGTEFIEARRSNVTDFESIFPCQQTRVKSWIDQEVTRSRMYELHRIYKSKDSQELKNAIREFQELEILRCKYEHPKSRRKFKRAVKDNSNNIEQSFENALFFT